MHQPRVVFGLGSNLGNSIEHLRRALNELRMTDALRVLNVSSLYESDAQMPEGAPAHWNRRFLNAAVLCEFKVGLNAEDLLSLAKVIEQRMLRKPLEKWAPRLIDIDILYWSQSSYESSRLKIPHTSLTDRPFALLPLLELWPEADVTRPLWASGWIKEKPFNTQISKNFFWPQIVGILNVTPDSFSDGQVDMNQEFLQKRAAELVSQGADIIDIGAESTRPAANTVSAEEELTRLQMAFSSIADLKLPLRVSIDCRRARVLEKILSKYEVHYINDVSGFSDPEMVCLLSDSGCHGFVMHSLSVPPQPGEVISENQDPFLTLYEWWANKSSALEAAGVSAEKLTFDIGIGFAKTSEQSLYILKNLQRLHAIKNKIMVGHSRKSYLRLLSDQPPHLRDTETALMTQKLNLAFVQYLRVHDIQSQKTALRAGALLQ